MDATESTQVENSSDTIKLDRESLVRAAIEVMRTQTRRGPKSQIDELPESYLHSIGLLKAQGAKHDEIHAQLIEALKASGIEGDEAPNYYAVNRWLDRFGYEYSLERSKRRNELAKLIPRANLTGDLQEDALIANKVLLGALVDTLAECPDLRDLSNGQLGNLLAGVHSVTKAAFNEKKLAAQLKLAEQRGAKLETETQALREKLDTQRRAAEQAQAAVEREAAKSPDGRVDASSIMAALRAAIVGGDAPQASDGGDTAAESEGGAGDGQ